MKMKHFFMASACLLLMISFSGCPQPDSTPEKTPPAAPKVSAKVGGTSANLITIKWDKVNDATGYDVYYSTLDDASKADKKGYTAETTYTLTGLATSTTYYTWVKAKNAEGDSSFSSALKVTTTKDPTVKPTAPAIPVKVAVSETTITIKWDRVDDATDYIVYADSEEKATVKDLFYTIKGLTADTEYKLSLKAENAKGPSDFSTELTVKTDPTPTAVPADPAAPVKVSASGTTISIEWTLVGGVTGYDIYIKDDDGTINKKNASPVTDVPYTLTGLAANEEYKILLSARNVVGTSGYSSELIAKTASAAPTGLTKGTTTANSIVINWAEVTGADVTGYDVYYSDSDTPVGASKVSVTGGSTVTATIKSLTASTPYYIWVKAKNKEGDSAFSSMLTAKTRLAAPELVKVKDGSTTQTNISIYWSAVADATRYDVYFNKLNNPLTAELHGSTSSWDTSYDISSTPTTPPVPLTADTAYYVWVKAKSSEGQDEDSALSTVVEAKTLAVATPTIPAVPQYLSSDDITTTSMYIRWNNVTGAEDSYDVYYSASNVAPDAETTPTTTSSGNSVNISSSTNSAIPITPNTTYYIWVRAKNTVGPSDYSSMLEVKTLAIPTVVPVAPKDLYSDDITTTSMDIRWDKVTGADTYDVYLGETKNSADAIKNNTSNITYGYHALRDLKVATTYYIWVTATNIEGEGAYSSMLTATTAPKAVPVAPEQLISKASFATTISISWKEAPWTTRGYDVYYSTSKNVPTESTEPIKSTYSTSYDITGLSANTTYYIWVRAKNEEGPGAYSTMLTATTVSETSIPVRDRVGNYYADGEDETLVFMFQSDGS